MGTAIVVICSSVSVHHEIGSKYDKISHLLIQLHLLYPSLRHQKEMTMFRN